MILRMLPIVLLVALRLVWAPSIECASTPGTLGLISMILYGGWHHSLWWRHLNPSSCDWNWMVTASPNMETQTSHTIGIGNGVFIQAYKRISKLGNNGRVSFRCSTTLIQIWRMDSLRSWDCGLGCSINFRKELLRKKSQSSQSWMRGHGGHFILCQLFRTGCWEPLLILAFKSRIANPGLHDHGFRTTHEFALSDCVCTFFRPLPLARGRLSSNLTASKYFPKLVRI